MYRFFDASSDGNSVTPFAGRAEQALLHFPRQVAGERLSLADFVRPASAGGPPDSVALLLTTAGEGVRARAEDLKNRGEYLLCHSLQALAVETAEAAAEWLHEDLRRRWGFPDDAVDDDDGPLPGALPRQTVQPGISGVAGASRSDRRSSGFFPARRSASS